MNLACPVLSRHSTDLACTAHSRLLVQCYLVCVVVVLTGVTATFAGILISKIPTSKEKALSTMTFFFLPIIFVFSPALSMGLPTGFLVQL